MTHLKVVLLTKRPRFVALAVSVITTYLGGYAAMSNSILTKICSKCKASKSLSEFHKMKDSKDGFRPDCKSCRVSASKIYYDNHQVERSEYNKKWTQDNKEYLSDYHKKYCKDNNERIKKRNKKKYEENLDICHERGKKYYQKNKAKRLDQAKEYYKKNKERIIAYREANSPKIKKQRKQYQKDNREQIAERKRIYSLTEVGKSLSRKYSSKRRALKLNATTEDFNPIEVFKRDGYRCQLCGIKTKYYKTKCHPNSPELDHIVPLSLGGPHTRLNTQCLCRGCNLTKNNTGTGDQLRLF